jgi:hypothetical protein
LWRSNLITFTCDFPEETMRSVTVSILLAFVIQGSATDDAQKSADNYLDKMIDRAFNASSFRREDLEQALHHMDMDDSTLGKTGQLATRAGPVPMSRLSAPVHTSMPRRMPTLMANQQVTPAAQERDIEQMKQQLKTAVKSMVAAGAVGAPLAAHAEVTPSLQNLLNSVIAGGVVVGAIAAAVGAVASFDPVDRT